MSNAPLILKGSFGSTIIFTRCDGWIETEFVFMRFRDVCIMVLVSREAATWFIFEWNERNYETEGWYFTFITVEPWGGFCERGTKKRIKGFIGAIISGTLARSSDAIPEKKVRLFYRKTFTDTLLEIHKFEILKINVKGGKIKPVFISAPDLLLKLLKNPQRISALF